MDGNRFDDLTRRLADVNRNSISRRTVLRGAAAGLLAAFGAQRRGDAQVTQAYCGDVSCRTNPAKCKQGCVCCVWPNKNSRCMPPGRCGYQEVCPPGKVVDPDLGCVTPTPATTAAPTTTTTTTTAAPTTTTTTTAEPTTTTTTTTTSPPCGGSCAPDQVCCNGTCQMCCDDSHCEDIDVCHTGRCQGGVCISAGVVCDLPDDFIDCTDQVCDVALGGCVHKPFHGFCPPTSACNEGFCDTEIVRGCTTRPFTGCPTSEFECVRTACDPSTGCFLVQDHDSCPTDNFCDIPFCSTTGGCTTVPRICPIPVEASDCYDTFCDPVSQSCVSVPVHTACPESSTLYNCTDPFCYPQAPSGNGGCGFTSLCQTAGQNGCGPIDEQHGCICTDAFVTGGSCVNSGPQ